MSAASTSNPSFILKVEKESLLAPRLEIEEDCPNLSKPGVQEYPYLSKLKVQEYPYPSHNFATNIVTVKLCGKPKYNVWNTQMICLLSSHGMHGFIDGQVIIHFDGNWNEWTTWYKSDSLVKGWIIGSLSEETAINVVNRLTREHKNSEFKFTARDVWDEQQRIYGPSVREQAA
ncbi:hypothetical protein Tco_0179829, partial [Tanacetum coccineum]